MLRTLTFPDSELETTVLGFGCAHLYGVPRSAERLRLLAAAHDAGIRHFDVAPMYGLGLAERELGRFIRHRREAVVVATKFGIAPTLFARSLARVQVPVRRLFLSLPALRERARSTAAGPASGRAGALLYDNVGYDAASAKASLEESLRQLRTEYVDLLLLHDPLPGDVRSDEVRAYLEDARRDGRIRAWGVTGELAPSVAVARALSGPVPVLQLRDDIFLRSLRAVPPATASGLIVFGVLGRALKRLVAHLSADSRRRHRWSAAVGADCSRLDTIASLLFRDALQENSSGVVLFSTIRPERVSATVMAAEGGGDAPDPALERFRGLVEAELQDGYEIVENAG